MITIEDLKQENNVDITEVYGIVYRIYCKTENKSYIGQTLSHNLVKDKWFASGIKKRLERHFDFELNENKRTKITEVLKKYPKNDFEIYIEEKVPGNKINTLNKLESDYMKKYNTLEENGYNFVKMSTSISKAKQKLIDYYNLSIDEEKYVDDTRQRRAKDITTGLRFKNNDERKAFFKDKEVENVIITYSSNALRVLVSCKGMKDKYRLILGQKKKEALELAKYLYPNFEIKSIAKDFLEDKHLDETYKLQDRLDNLLKEENFTSISGKFYFHKRFNGYTYTLFFYGKKKNRIIIKDKISFGGKYDTIQSIYDDAMIFINKFLEKVQIDEINLQEPETFEKSQNQCLQQVATK